MNRRQKIIVSVVGIFIILLALVGLTYGYFLTRIQGNTNTTSITVTTADLKLVYKDGSPNIEALNIEPGDTISTKKFTVSNEGNATVENYNVYLENVINSFELKSDVTYTLTCKSYTKYGETDQTESGTCTGASKTTFPSVMSIIATNTINVGITHEYEMTVVYEETNTDQSIDMNKEINAKINIYDNKTKFLSSEIIKNATSTATVEYNKTKYIDPSLQDGTTYTIPASQINLQNERVMSYTLDDDGTSYYFRGNVEDNYVNFANMCWRIVRITGNGNIKLILEDQDDICSEADGNWNIPASDGETLTIDETTNTPYLTGNYGYDDITYTENSYIANYLNPTPNSASRSMVNAFKYFQNNSLNEYTDKLSVGDWCFENLAYSDKSGTTLVENKEDYFNRVENGDFYYNSYVRLSGNKGIFEPTLKCNGNIINNFSNNTIMYVATITADEAIFSGTKDNVEFINNYLVNDYQINNSLRYRLLTISRYNINHDKIYGLMSNFYLRDNINVQNDGFSFKPAIVLLNNVNIENIGNGTKTSPYVVTE